LLKPEDGPNAGLKHVAYLIQPYIIKDSCARRTKFLPLQLTNNCFICIHTTTLEINIMIQHFSTSINSARSKFPVLSNHA